MPSPCECRLSVDLCTTTTGRYRNSLSSIPRAQTVELATLRRRVSNISGPTVSPGSSSSNQITSGTHLARPNWSSMPSSPTHARATSSSSSSTARHTQLPRKTRSKVTFQGMYIFNCLIINYKKIYNFFFFFHEKSVQ